MAEDDRRRVRHDCTENDNHLIFEFEDGNAGEVLVGDCLEKSHLVVGFGDLKAALKKAGYELRPVEVAAEPCAMPPPVDRSKRELSDGSPETANHREINPATGQQRGYVVLSPEERAKGFVRPLRRTYKHVPCGTVTTMGLSIAETYARDPTFYSGTFCTGCRTHHPLSEFVWDGTDEVLGS